MDQHRVQLQLSTEMLRAGADIARDRDITLGQLVRDLLSREISRHRNARPPNRADERLVAPLRARLAGDFADATGWNDLRHRLARKGYELRAAGGGLALHRLEDGARQCKASELGFGYSGLVERFGAAFPGHQHTWIAARAIARRMVEQVDLVGADGRLTEPFGLNPAAVPPPDRRAAGPAPSPHAGGPAP